MLDTLALQDITPSVRVGGFEVELCREVDAFRVHHRSFLAQIEVSIFDSKELLDKLQNVEQTWHAFHTNHQSVQACERYHELT